MNNPDIKYDLVTFTFDGDDERIYLKLEGEFVLSAGIKPNINRAIVPYTEFEKLNRLIDTAGGKPHNRLLDPGTVEFWYSGSPEDDEAEPDVTIPRVRIIDVEPLLIGKARTANPNGKIDSEKSGIVRVLEARLYLSDFRENFVEPFGGILADGKVNDEKLKPDDPNLVQNEDLITRCLQAMRIGTFFVPASVNDAPPKRGLNWDATPAPKELEELLQYVQAAAIPGDDGSLNIAQIGDGEGPNIPYEDETPRISIPGIGRRGTVLVLTSAPYPTIETLTLDGPDPSTWEYVIQNGLDDWVPIDTTSLFPNGPETSMKKLFTDVSPKKFTNRCRDQAWHCIRLSDQFDRYKAIPSGVPRISPGDDGGYIHATIYAIIAQLGDDGLWRNSDGPIYIPIAHQLEDPKTQQPIFIVEDVLGRADPSPAFDLAYDFARLASGDMQIRFSFYPSVKKDKGPNKKGNLEFYFAGFSFESGGLKKLSDDDLADILAQKDAPDKVAFVAAKELQLRRVDGNVENQSDVDQAAQSLAQKYFGGAGDDAQIIVARGFIKSQLSGRVCEMRWDQEKVQTTFKVNTWHYPLASIGIFENLRRLNSQHFQAQHSTVSYRLYTGGPN